MSSSLFVQTPILKAVCTSRKRLDRKVSELEVETSNQVWIGSISVGVAEITQEFESMNELVKAADESVYLAKNAGKNSVCSIQI